MRDALGDLPQKIEIEARAEELRQRHPGGPPVDVDIFLRELGVLKVVVADIKQDAMLVGDVLEGFLIAVVKADTSWYRRRFSLAHEAGHLVLDPERKAQGYQHQIAGRGKRGPLERACDYFAGCLLMPRTLVLAERELTASAISRRYEVSAQAAEVRLRELGHNRRGSR